MQQVSIQRGVWGTDVLLTLCISRIQPHIQGFFLALP